MKKETTVELKDCPVCWGSSWETQFITPCKECKGTGKVDATPQPATTERIESPVHGKLRYVAKPEEVMGGYSYQILEDIINNFDGGKDDRAWGLVVGEPKERAIAKAERLLECWNNYEQLKEQVKVLLKDNTKLIDENEKLKAQKETAMLLALEYGYKQCEKGENLDGAFLNYNKLITQK